MNTSPASVQLLSEIFGAHLMQRALLIYAAGSIIAFIALVFLLKKLTRWPFLVTLVVVTVTSILSFFVSFPFQVITKLLDLALKEFQLSLPVSNLFSIFVIVWQIVTWAISFFFSLKTITYFSKEKTYAFRFRFFWHLVFLSSLPYLLYILDFLMSYLMFR